MNKPTKPSVALPISFGGDKQNFSTDKITNGYEKDIKDIFKGSNLNYLLDTSGQNFDYLRKIADFVNDIPTAKTITVNANNELIYRDWLGGRNFGELVYSSIPLSDSGLKLLDGSIVQGSGIYKNFVDYIATIVNTYSSIFTTEENWQTTVSQYGVCGKYVYDSVNNTVRLPKVTGIIEGTIDVNALGNIVAAGLPTLTTNTDGSHTHSGTTGKGSAHTHTRGTMEIKGSFLPGADYSNTYPKGSTSTASGAFYLTKQSKSANVLENTGSQSGEKVTNINFQASKNWTGATSSESSHTHSFSITSSGAHNHTIKWGATTNTVQPQTVKMFVYVVVANGINKTDVELDIDEIVSDLNYKADIDLSNATENISNSAKSFFTRLALPSITNVNITIPLSGSTITIPADGYICCSSDIKLTNNTRRLYGNNMAVVKDDIITVTYNSLTTNVSEIFFVYAQGGLS